MSALPIHSVGCLFHDLLEVHLQVGNWILAASHDLSEVYSQL